MELNMDLTSVQWVNSIHIKNDFTNTILVKEKIVTIDKDTSKVLHTKNRLRPIKDPKRIIYVTKPEFRTHKVKRDVEDLSKVDPYIVEDRLLVDRLKEILGVPKYMRKSLRELCNSPYVYNADISMEALIRAKYQERQKHNIIPLTIGSLDIETSVLGDDQINLITFCAENNVYTAVLDGFLWKYVNNQKVKATELDIRKQIKKDIQQYIDKYGFSINIKICETELELIKWIFSKIHQEEMDFITIWNMGFDIPKILERIKSYGIDPVDICCHPSVPKQLRVCKFKEDKREVQHIVEKWHWFYCTSMSQFVDAMTLYARIRKSKPKEPSYTLDAISSKVVGAGKLKFSEGSHYEMQTKRFVEYVVYNMVDAMLLMMMEWQNHDVSQMLRLTGSSTYDDFNKQTVMLKNIYYKFCLDNNKVFASTGKDMKGPYDDLFSKSGGAVLKASLVNGIGINSIIERPDYESNIVPTGADLDFKAYYPSTESMYGLSKETKICTVVGIDSRKDVEYIEGIMGGIASPQANAVWIGHDYFGLPNYEEWQELAMKEFFKA